MTSSDVENRGFMKILIVDWDFCSCQLSFLHVNKMPFITCASVRTGHIQIRPRGNVLELLQSVLLANGGSILESYVTTKGY